MNSILTVSELNRQARELMEASFAYLAVEGEVSNLATPASGHVYFTLKDNNAAIRCAMFRKQAVGLDFRPVIGMGVVARGRLSIYEQRGDYQLIVGSLEEAGEGALWRKFEKLKSELDARGYFDPATKLQVPAFPRRIAVVTSPSGAALHDVLLTLKRRFPAVPVTIVSTTVQGNHAAGEIARALNLASESTECDVILLVRGGGSLEDLWPFNTLTVADAIRQCRIPVISGVGHEVDFTIADFTSDIRAATPTAAAELVSEGGKQLARQTEIIRKQLLKQIDVRIGSCSQRLDYAAQKVVHPTTRLLGLQEKAFSCQRRIDELINGLVLARWSSLHHCAAMLRSSRPLERILREQEQVCALTRILDRMVKHKFQDCLRRTRTATQQVRTLSPRSTLNRGYAIARTLDGKIIKLSSAVEKGEIINVGLSQGSLDVQVEQIRTDTDQ